MKKLIFLFSFFISFSGVLIAQNRGLELVSSPTADKNVKIGKQYAVLIAIDKYQEWNPLRNPDREINKP